MQKKEIFKLNRKELLDTLKIEVEEYTHTKTGAKHYHLATEDQHNVFIVAFRTVPEDSSGVAHILEHTVLCGSKKYPVRDPFFMMIRRSLNTFMNAFTSSDWTAYPFASQNKNDFNNLLQVYLDAAFFPRLDELDFAQEGHRLEFEKQDDPNSKLVYKGVVFNEMKGSMSSPINCLWQAITKNIFPSVTYHYNSGGDPRHIPKLTHKALKEFHANHYHPSNAVFMTYGDITAQEHQKYFQENALKNFSASNKTIFVGEENRFKSPKTVTENYSVNSIEEEKDKTHIVIAWLLGKNSDIKMVMNAHLLSGILLENSASPLRKALETTSLGNAPSPMCGLEDSTHEMLFACGVEGSNPEHVEEVEKLVLSVLQNVVENGIPQEQIESVLHQVELSQREIGGDTYPYGLQLMLNALTPALHGADPIDAMNIDSILVDLREKIKQPDFIKNLIKDLLLNNNHRLNLALLPDAGRDSKLAKKEAKRLDDIKSKLSDKQKQMIIKQSEDLEKRQNTEDDPEILPKVGLADIPPDMKIAAGSKKTLAKIPASIYNQSTNGILYNQIIVTLPQFDDDLLELLPLFSEYITEVGSGDRDYLTTQTLQSSVTGGISGRTSVRSHVDNLQKMRGFFVLSGKSLNRNGLALTRLLKETLESAKFDELSRLRELISQSRFQSEQSITGQGHSLVIGASVQNYTPVAYINQQWNGFTSIKQIKALDEAVNDPTKLKALAKKLKKIKEIILEAPIQLLLVSEKIQQHYMEENYNQIWSQYTQPTSRSQLVLPEIHGEVNQAWTTNTQVNFCARSYPVVPVTHTDAPTLMVLGGFLRNGFLHRTIREQGGAYGGGANYDTDTGSFRFYSYRDPRLEETLLDFNHSLDWLAENKHEERQLEEAILGVISSIDHPSSPSGEAKKAFYNLLHGRTPDQRRQVRENVLDVTIKDLQRVGAFYLNPKIASTAVLTNKDTLATVKNHEMEIFSL